MLISRIEHPLQQGLRGWVAVTDLGDKQGGGGAHDGRGLRSGMGQSYLGETGLVCNLMVYVARSAVGPESPPIRHNYNFVTIQAIICGQERVGIGRVRHAWMHAVSGRRRSVSRR